MPGRASLPPGRFASRRPLGRWIVAASLASLAAGCSLRQVAVDSVGDALSSGPSVFERDDDLVLVGDALPFSLKLLDSLVAESPRHRGLLLAASRGYLLYAYGYVGFEADRLTHEDVDRANRVRLRAHRLALRAHGYALRAAELAHPGFAGTLQRDPAGATSAIASADELDVAYATTASLAVAIGSARQDAAMLARMPEVDALLARMLVLDEAWNAGALHELALVWLAARPGPFDRAAVDAHYARALALDRGTRATLFVSYAESVSVRSQDRRQFDDLVGRALAVDPDARPDERLQNALAQQRARWLQTQAERLFVE